MTDYSGLEAKLGVTFKNRALLTQAFLHRSYLNEHREIKLEHNERLEFLGDAVLELIVTDYLYRQYPNNTEGALTAYRAALVNAGTLSALASDLGFNDYLLLSRGELRDTGRARQMILANTFESVLGALYLDQGYEAARGLIERQLLPEAAKIVTRGLWQDAKSLFQEKAQEMVGITPVYQVINQVGPDHAKRFTVGLYLTEELVAEGSGHSKQEAEQEAATIGLKIKGWSKTVEG